MKLEEIIEYFQVFEPYRVIYWCRSPATGKYLILEAKDKDGFFIIQSIPNDKDSDGLQVLRFHTATTALHMNQFISPDHYFKIPKLSSSRLLYTKPVSKLHNNELSIQDGDLVISTKEILT